MLETILPEAGRPGNSSTLSGESSIEPTGFVKRADTMCTHWYIHGSMLLYMFYGQQSEQQVWLLAGLSCHRESSTWLQLVQRCYCRVLAGSFFCLFFQVWHMQKVTYYKKHGRRAQEKNRKKTQKKYFIINISPYLQQSDMSFRMWYILWNIPDFFEKKREKQSRQHWR